MRIWSIHPKYLDSKGLVALWRETLLAKTVIGSTTKGYSNHAQLVRFKALTNPSDALNMYLSVVWQEAKNRGYHFDQTKFIPVKPDFKMPVNKGQLEYEFQHLLSKLITRDLEKHASIIQTNKIEPHPLFQITDGGIEKWEKVTIR